MMPSEDTKILEFNQYKKSDEPSFIIYADLKYLIDSKILEFNQYKKSDKPTFIIYVDLKCLIEETDGCKNNPENSSITKVVEHIPSGFAFKSIEHNHDVYRGKDKVRTYLERFDET